MVLILLWLALFYSSIDISTHGLLQVGDKCTFQKTGQHGICALIDDCNSAKEGLRRRERPQHCGFDGFAPIVCCTDSSGNAKITNTRRKVGDISLQKCMEYSKLIYPTNENEKCPLVNEDDAGYRSAQPKEFPHTVLVGIDYTLGISWICFAVLISESYILTTTDCLTRANQVARFGANFNSISGVQLRNITELIPFPEYLSRNKDNNIALAKLSSPVELNEFVHPACVHADVNLGTKFFASDGEKFYERADGANTYINTKDVKKVTLATTPYEECKENFKPIGKTKEEYICATPIATPHKDPCRPKGPLLTMHPTAFCMQTVVGLNVFRNPNCNFSIRPNGYTGVHNYIDWIEKNVWIEEGKS